MDTLAKNKAGFSIFSVNWLLFCLLYTFFDVRKAFSGKRVFSVNRKRASGFREEAKAHLRL